MYFFVVTTVVLSSETAKSHKIIILNWLNPLITTCGHCLARVKY